MSTGTIPHGSRVADHARAAAMLPHTYNMPIGGFWLRYDGERATVLAVYREAVVPVGVLNPAGRSTGYVGRDVLADGELIGAVPRLLAAVQSLRCEDTVDWAAVRSADRAVASWWKCGTTGVWFQAPNRLAGPRRDVSRANSLIARFGIDADAPRSLVHLITAAPMLALAVRSALSWQGQAFPFAVQVVDDALAAAAGEANERSLSRYRFDLGEE